MPRNQVKVNHCKANPVEEEPDRIGSFEPGYQPWRVSPLGRFSSAVFLLQGVSSHLRNIIMRAFAAWEVRPLKSFLNPKERYKTI